MTTPLRRYYRGHNLVTMREVQANASRHYHFDHQGTTQCLTDGSGAVTDRFSSDSWGLSVRRTGSSGNRHWYVGNAGYQAENGRSDYYVRERVYTAIVARWATVDPLFRRSLVEAPDRGGPKLRFSKSRWTARLCRLLGTRLDLGRALDASYAGGIESSAARWMSCRSLPSYLYCDNRGALLTDPSGLAVTSYGECPDSVGDKCPGKCPYGKTCKEICKDAESIGTGAGVSGTVICGQGMMCACTWLPTGSCSPLIECAALHEGVHCVQKGICNQCSDQLTQGRHFVDPGGRDRFECQAYLLEWACLVGKLLEGGHSQDCVNQMQNWAGFVIPFFLEQNQCTGYEA